MKQFVSQPKDEPAEDPIEFALDGITYTAVRPTSEQMLLLLGDWHDDNARAAGVVSIFHSIVTPSDVLMRRLNDRTDPFDLSDVHEVMRWLTSEWNALDAERDQRPHLSIVKGA